MDTIPFKTRGLNNRYHWGYYQGSKHSRCLFEMCLSQPTKLFHFHPGLGSIKHLGGGVGLSWGVGPEAGLDQVGCLQRVTKRHNSKK